MHPDVEHFGSCGFAKKLEKLFRADGWAKIADINLHAMRSCYNYMAHAARESKSARLC